jgi:preprotein translocase subunit SecF
MRKVIEFSKSTRVAVIISLLLIVAGLVGTFVQGGFNFGIDFQAGLSQRVQVNPNRTQAAIGQVRSALANVAGVGAEVQVIGPPAEQQFTLRVRDTGAIDNFETVAASEILAALQGAFGSGAVSVLEQSYIGPRFSADLTTQAISLVVLAFSLILIYLWFRFRFAYAGASIIALIHDVSFMIAFIGLFQIEITSATIAAVLTIVGYSLNDTIVIFDRIRENEAVMGESKLKMIIDGSITQSLSRTIITSITTLIAVLSIYIFTTGQIQDFALALIVGIIVGTYSSIYIASPSFYSIVQALKTRAKKREASQASKKSATKQISNSKVETRKKAGAKG